MPTLSRPIGLSAGTRRAPPSMPFWKRSRPTARRWRCSAASIICRAIRRAPIGTAHGGLRTNDRVAPPRGQSPPRRSRGGHRAGQPCDALVYRSPRCPRRTKVPPGARSRPLSGDKSASNAWATDSSPPESTCRRVSCGRRFNEDCAQAANHFMSAGTDAETRRWDGFGGKNQAVYSRRTG